METSLVTKYRIFKLIFEFNVNEYGSMWTYKHIQGEEDREFDSEKEALEWVHENSEIMIRCREFVIFPVYHLALA